MKRVLVLHYSQTGQLSNTLKAALAPMSEVEGIEIVWHCMTPERAFPFPWTVSDFFDVFPESVCLEAPPLKLAEIPDEQNFDLIILGYQVWYLSPSLPVTGFLQSDLAKRVFKDRPVITFVVCRNMWLKAQQTVELLLSKLGARVIDKVALTDQGPPWATFVTTPRWLLTGRKNGFWKIFPAAGVSPEEVRSADRFGRAIRDALLELTAETNRKIESCLSELAPFQVIEKFVYVEELGHRVFKKWASFIRNHSRSQSLARKYLLGIFCLSLVFSILILMPMVIVMKKISPRRTCEIVSGKNSSINLKPS